LLEQLDLSGPGYCTIRALAGPPRVLLDACASLDVEGVVAKRVDSPYRPGVRSADWLKLKTVDWKHGHAPRRLLRRLRGRRHHRPPPGPLLRHHAGRRHVQRRNRGAVPYATAHR
jgi:hypothetical protein